MKEQNTVNQRPLRKMAPIKRGIKAGNLLKFAETWQGDDLKECLQFARGNSLSNRILINLS